MTERVFDKIIQYSFYLLFFLVPLILTPWNYELFEYNKMMLTYALTVIIIGAWIGKMIVQAEIKVQKTPLDIPIILYLISYILSTIFSMEHHTSVWGYYSRFHGGLLSTICYILLYYAFVASMKKEGSKKLVINSIYVLLGSAFLVTSYGILERFGIDAKFWVQDVKNRVFSTLGQPNWLGAFIDAIIFIPLALASVSLNKLKKSLFFVLYFLFFLCLIFTNSKSAILAFWLGLIVFSLLILFLQRNLWKKLSLLWLTTLIIYLLLGSKTYSYIKKAPLWLNIFSTKPTVTPSPIKQNISKPPIFISESSDIRKVVWRGAIEIWKNHPLFGSGVETFAYAYYQFRPVEHNLLSEWDFLYNKAHNEFLNILACQGTVGIITYLLLIGTFLFWCLKQISNFKFLISPPATLCVALRAGKQIPNPKSQKKLGQLGQLEISNLLIALLAGYITILITNFFGFSVVIIGILFFLIPAFSFTLTETCKDRVFTLNLTGGRKHVKTGSLQDALLIILFFSVLFALYSILKLWQADYYFARGKKYYKANYLINSLADLEKALKLNPREALYHNQLAQAAAKLAAVYHQTEATRSAQIVERLKNLAVQEVKTTLDLNSVHLNFYKSTAKTYLFLSIIDPSFKNKALEVLEKATQLAPTDAKIFYNLGVLYQQLDNLKKAQKAYELAVNLKPDYRRVRIELAKLYQQTGQTQKAKAQLLFILEKINPNDKLAQKLLKDIEKE